MLDDLRSIPAGAGEPNQSAREVPDGRVYPRGCGGASGTQTIVPNHDFKEHYLEKAMPSRGIFHRCSRFDLTARQQKAIALDQILRRFAELFDPHPSRSGAIAPNKGD